MAAECTTSPGAARASRSRRLRSLAGGCATPLARRPPGDGACSRRHAPQSRPAMSLRHHEIAEAGHRILDPFTDDEAAAAGRGVRAWGRGRGSSTSRAARARCCAGGPRGSGSTGWAWTSRTCSWRPQRERAAELGVARPRVVRAGRRGAYVAGGRARSTSRAASGRPGSAAGSPGRWRSCGRRSAPDGLAARRRAVLHRRAARRRRWRRWGFGPGRLRLAGRDGGPARCGRASSSSRWSSPTATAGTATRRRSGGPWRTGSSPTRTIPTTRRCAGSWPRTGDAYLRWGRRYLGWGVFVTRPR